MGLIETISRVFNQSQKQEAEAFGGTDFYNGGNIKYLINYDRVIRETICGEV